MNQLRNGVAVKGDHFPGHVYFRQVLPAVNIVAMFQPSSREIPLIFAEIAKRNEQQVRA